jgi:DNA-binding LacI/PurR family transcriptional regulator
MEDDFPTLKQVAERAGVSTSTASRAISSTGYTSGEARDRVLQAARELGYEPDLAARTLKFRSSSILGVEIQDITNPFYAALATGINDVARAAGYVPLVIDSQEDPRREAENLRVMLQTRVAGLIIVPTLSNVGLLRRFQRHGIPLVQLDRLVPQVATDSVLADDFGGALEGTRHLIGLGHTRIGVIAGPRGLTTGRQRLAGFEQAMKEHGIPIDERYIKVSDYRSETGGRLARELLDERPRPTAIFTHNNVLAENLLGALAECQVSIPDDVAVITFDDPSWARLVTPPLTVIQQPAHTMGSVAADLLLKRIRSPSTEPALTRVELSATLIVRGSCGAPAAGLAVA